MGERFLELGERGVTLCVDRRGAGAPLLVMSGTGSDLRNRPNAFEWPMASSFEVTAYDHRCLGRSEQHDPDYQPTMADFALDALALCDAEGLDRFSLIGISFGGMVAQELAIRAGSRVDKLILCCTSPGGEGGSSYPLHDLYASGRTTDDIFEVWDTRTATDDKVRSLMERIFDGNVRPPEPPPGLLKQIEARRHHDVWSRLDQVEASTMVAYGRYDGVAPPENSERIVSAIPSAVAAPFEGGHLFQWQDRTAWPAMIDFLAS